MKMRHLIGLVLVVALVAAVLVAGFVGVPVPARFAHMEQLLPPGYAETHASLRYAAFTGEVRVTDLVILQGGTPIAQAASASVGGRRESAAGQHIGVLDVTGLAFGKGIGHGSVGKLGLTDLDLPADAALPASVADARLLASAVSFAHLRVHDVAVGAGPASVSIATLAVDDFSHGAIGEADIGGLAMAVVPVAPVLPVALSLGVRAAQYRHFPRLWVSSRSFTALSPAEFGALVDPAHPSDATMTGMVFRAGDLGLTVETAGGSTAFSAQGEHGTSSLDGGVVHLQGTLATGPRAAFARGLGLDGAQFSGRIEQSYDAASHRYVVQSSDFSIKQLGALDASSDVAILGPQGGGLPGQLLLNGAKLRWTDAGLTSRVLAQVAASQQTTPDTIRMQAGIALQAMAASKPAFAAVWTALGSFLQNPTSLTFILAPPQPLDLATLRGMDPAQVPAQLGLSASSP